MSLIITSPITADPFGPGFQLTASSTFVGPLEPDSFWLITITAPPAEDVLLTMTVPTDTNALSTLVVQGSMEFPGVVEGRPTWITGADAQVQVDLVEPIGGTVDSNTVQVILDRQTGQNAELRQWIEQQLLAQPVGLTTEQGEQLNRVEASTTTTLGPGVIDLVTGLSGLIVHPALSLGSLFTPGYDLTGDGVMPDLNSATSQAFGIYWTATIPAGFGHLHGNSEEYNQRLVQFRTVHTLGGVELVTEIADFNTHGNLWTWTTPLPTRIEYSVTPGVVVHARWWRLGV